MAQNPLAVPTVLEESEIQRLLLSGYASLPYGQIFLFTIHDSARFSDWLEQHSLDLSYGGPTAAHEHSRLNLAFTYAALELLGLPSTTLEQFPLEFQQGPLSPRRLRILGDTGSSSPSEWHWGGPDDPEVHLTLLLYAKDLTILEKREKELSFHTSGLKLIQKSPAHLDPEHKDHFGFKDGIVQPQLRERSPRGPAENILPSGEFILGYHNAREEYPASPSVQDRQDPDHNLPEHRATPGAKDFGCNGSFLVYRQLKQNVTEFWDFLENKAAELPEKEKDATWLAAKMVGRWPSGAPLTLSPDQDDPNQLEGPNDYFSYAEKDPDGLRCPFASHVRRSNPRDALYPNAALSTQFTRLHRIIRRGRPYTLGEEKGLNFLCFNADIANQFEFIQHDWMNNPKFADVLYDESDPISGYQDPKHPELTHNFSIPGKPLRTRVSGLPRFVDVRGSAYFFMPSRKALHFLISLQNRKTPQSAW